MAEASYGPLSTQSVAIENVAEADLSLNLAFVVLSITAVLIQIYMDF